MTWVIAGPCIDVKDEACAPENAEFFDQLGPPGGAAKTGPLPYHTDYIASYVTGR
jgi:hypothetical protein